MIELPTVSEKELLFYKGKKVVVNDYSEHAKLVCEIFQYLDIDVIAFCSNHFKSRFVQQYKGVPVIQPDQILSMLKNHREVVIQPLPLVDCDLLNRTKELEAFGAVISPVPTGKLVTSLTAKILVSKIRTEEGYRIEARNWKKIYSNKYVFSNIYYFVLKNLKNPVGICLPMKTADYTLQGTFDVLNMSAKQAGNSNAQIIYRNFIHKPRQINKLLFSRGKYPVKIITAVREPISQNISSLFQGLSDGYFFNYWIMGDLEGKSAIKRREHLSNIDFLLVQNNTNVQMLWDAYVERYIYSSDERVKNSNIPRSIQSFLLEFNKCVLNLYDYPFNQEKGYTIIKEGNVEVFVYQLEKLNSLVPTLSAWIGVPFDKLENANQAEDKWIAKSYKQTRKEIEITKKYFDKCFNERYVKHCYSEADIEKFKARWRPHIKQDKP